MHETTTQHDDLRHEMHRLRDELDPGERLQMAEAIQEHLVDLPAFRDAATVVMYLPVGSEVRLDSLIQRLSEVEGRRVLLPFDRAGHLDLGEWRPSDPLHEASGGRMQPRFRRSIPLEEAEVLVVPGLSFAPDGARLGNGSGRYAGLLARMSPATSTIGVTYSACTTAEIPEAVREGRVDVVVCETGVFGG